MATSGYELKRIDADMLPRVADLLCHLTHDSPENNLAYLTWKYRDNPFAPPEPLGFAAVKDGAVVGFRGFFPTAWHVPGRNGTITVLAPGDTVVDPAHRRQGLSVALGRLAMAELAADYPVFINLSAGPASVPGYLRMGFVRLHDKLYLTRASLLGLARYAFSRKPARLDDAVAFGDFGDFTVTSEPLPDAMARVAAAPPPGPPKLTRLQDEAYFRWRFAAGRKGRYVFCFARENGTVTGYVVLCVAPHNRRAYILDYSRRSPPAVEDILRFIVRTMRIGMYSVWSFTPDETMRKVLGKLGFRLRRLTLLRERFRRHVWPIMVRPVKESPAEEDWFVAGLDIRSIGSWELSQICSDSA